MLSKQSLFSAIVLLTCCVAAAAQKPVVNSNPTEEQTVGNITGSVVNESGQTLTGVTVFVREINPTGAGRSTATDADGNFRIAGLSPALYYVTAYMPAYVTRPTDTRLPANYYRIGDTVRIEMFRGGVITGTVTNASGEPVIGVRVRATMIRNAKNEASPMSTFVFSERTTDDRGIYRIFGLPQGTFLVHAGGASSVQTFSLTPYDSDMPTYAPSSTRDNAAEVSVRAGEETIADIRYRREPGHSVSGSATLSGSGNAQISLTAVGSVTPIASAFQMPGVRGFAFHGIGDGEYDVVAQEVKSITAASPELLMSEPRRITVKGADVTGIELVTRPLGSISGRIILEPAKVPACEGKRRPLFAEMLVRVERPEKDDKDTVPYLRMLSSSSSPDTNGSFVMRNLTPGRYLFEPRFYARYWYLNSIATGSTPKVDAAANWTTLKSGDQFANVTITIAEGAASIRGRVASAKETAVPAGLGVYLFPAEREKVADVLRYFVTSVEADGTFTLNNLPPGRYFTLVQLLDAQVGTMAKLRMPEAAESRTKLRHAAETQKTDLELKPCQNFTDYQLTLRQ
jgi:hypothetical protein